MGLCLKLLSDVRWQALSDGWTLQDQPRASQPQATKRKFDIGHGIPFIQKHSDFSEWLYELAKYWSILLTESILLDGVL